MFDYNDHQIGATIENVLNQVIEAIESFPHISLTKVKEQEYQEVPFFLN